MLSAQRRSPLSSFPRRNTRLGRTLCGQIWSAPARATNPSRVHTATTVLASHSEVARPRAEHATQTFAGIAACQCRTRLLRRRMRLRWMLPTLVLDPSVLETNRAPSPSHLSRSKPWPSQVGVAIAGIWADATRASSCLRSAAPLASLFACLSTVSLARSNTADGDLTADSRFNF